MLKIAFDFDGVCTDLSRLKSADVNLEEYLYSPTAIRIAAPRTGAMQLLSLLGLVGEVVVLSARPPDHRADVEEWLERHGLRHLVREVRCCGDEPKVACMARLGLRLAVEDDFVQASAVRSLLAAIQWEAQRWPAVATEALEFALSAGAQVGAAGGATLAGVRLVTEWGASEVFFFDTNHGGRLKIRVCSTVQERDALVAFLEATERHDYCHITRLVTTNGVAVVKSFVPGTAIGDTQGELRRRSVARIGVALAALHAIAVEACGAIPSLSLPDGNACLLVCAADNHNVIVTPEGEVVFVDLGAAAFGSRWVDLCWADDLLCRGAEERGILWAEYLAASQCAGPSDAELDTARRTYRVWLTQQLLHASQAHRADPGKSATIGESIRQLWGRQC